MRPQQSIGIRAETRRLGLTRLRLVEIAAAVLLTVAALMFVGLIRMGEGGHFLSDVVFAGVFMALDVALMSWLAFHEPKQRAPDEVWWHERTVELMADLRTKSESVVTASMTWLKQKFPEIFRNRIDPGEPPA